MSTILIILSLIGGLLFLTFGAEGLVRGSSAIALRMGISTLVVGLTVVSFGTSSPELVVSIKASAEGNSGIALGNVIGSNICNIALIIGVASLIHPMKVNSKIVKKEIPLMLFATSFLLIILWDGLISQIEGAVSVILLIIYIIYNIHSSRSENNKEINKEVAELVPKKKKNIYWLIFLTVGGLALLTYGAEIFVNGAVAAASRMGVSQAVIGLTIVAFGTSLPELFTSGIAALRKETDIAIGNVLGSNIFNILGILGIAALINPIKTEGLSKYNLIIMVLFAVIIWPISKSGLKISRWEGGILLAGYIAYIYSLLP